MNAAFFALAFTAALNPKLLALVGAVVVFALIEFLLIIIPWAFLELRPGPATAALRRSQAWLGSHARSSRPGSPWSWARTW